MKIYAIALIVVLAVMSVHAQKQVATDAPEPSGKHSKIPPPGRGKRAATCGTPTNLNSDQASESVTAHNNCRSREKAANMLKLEWSDEMAAVAKAWSDQCQWKHGMLADCNNNPVGQNLYVEANPAGYPKLNLTYVIEAWNNERNDWDWSKSQCTAGKLCGHWTQLVNARSAKVGCAFTLCPTITVGTEVWKNALYVACDYTPAGNVMGEPFYEPGTPCSHCDSDATGKGYTCDNNSCKQCSPATDANCKCGTPLSCQNGGSWSASTCTCTCPKGFYGLSCEKPCSCADVSTNCAGWSGFCTDPDYRDFMTTNCMTYCQYPCNLPAACN